MSPQPSERPFRLSVRDLIAFCFPPEDITPGGGVDELLAGGQAHRARQERQSGQAERALSHRFQLDGEAVELYGRMDAFTDGDVPLVEEMKLSGWQGENAMPEHRAQAVCYGAMLAAEQRYASVKLCVTYLKLNGEVLRSHTETLAGEALIGETEGWLRRYLVFALRERAHQRARDKSLRGMTFPYESYRKGQRELAAQVYTAIDRGKRLFASLPTGTGKSAAVLFPALKAMGEGKTGKLLYLTARNTARQGPVQALERMKAQGLKARVGVLTAKEKLCPAIARCHPDDCDRAKGHYLRQAAAEEALLADDAPLWTDEVIVAAADRFRLCPFELALRLTELADVALMDLNYAFDPFAQVKRLFSRKRRMTLLVDEAHHAVDRVRESLSGTLDSAALKTFRASFGKACGRKHPYYLALSALIRGLCALEPAAEPETAERPAKEWRLTALPEGIAALAEAVAAQASLVFQAGRAAPLGEVSAVLRLILPFLYAAEHLNEDDAILLEGRGQNRALTLYCLLPAREIARVTKGMRGVVFFSATLSPLPAMKALLGGDEADACFSLPSPFPPANLKVVRRRISTRYENRADSAAAVAEAITQAALAKSGHYIAFFPSYAYLKLVLEKLDESALPPLWVQERDMTEADREAFFAAFSEQGTALLGLCVLGGLFSEGVDLPGECLIGAIIVGVGLPTPSLKLRAIQACYQQHFGDGFGYACRVPALQKVAQAGGRLIRSETDKGLLVLLDSRYYESAYLSLLPAEWRDFREDIGQAAKELWG